MKMSKEEELQKKVIQFQLLESNFRIFQERAEIINERVEEMQKTRLALEEMDVKKATSALIPLGSGNFVFGKIDDSDNVIVGIGGGIAMKKNKKEAIEILNSKIKEYEKNMNNLSEQSGKIFLQLQKLQSEIEKLQE